MISTSRVTTSLVEVSVGAILRGARLRLADAAANAARVLALLVACNLPSPPGPATLPMAGVAYASQVGGEFQKDLCEHPDIIIIATVESRETRRVERYPRDTLMTTVTFYVERNLKGTFQQDQRIQLDWLGGVLEGEMVIVPGLPPAEVGSRYLLFLWTSAHFTQPFLEGYYRLPEDVELPGEAPLREVWAATCMAHPEGLYFRDSSVKLVIPRHLRRELNRFARDNW